MTNLLTGARRRALLAATALIAVAPYAWAADTRVESDEDRTTSLTMTGADTLTVEEGGEFITSGTSITLNGVTTTLTIDNAGTIQSTDNRAIRLQDNDANAHTVTIYNRTGALIESNGDDGIQIGNALNGGTITLDNDGTIRSTASRAINFNAATGGTINIINRASGTISADVGADVMRPGENATIENFGEIRSDENEDEFDGDGIDFQDKGGGTVNNRAGGLVEGSKHGITGDEAVSVLNEAGATIRGRNGSGINLDSGGASVAHVVNYGLISGEAQVESSTDTDGDGVDVDGLVEIENYGTIQALGARGFKDDVPTDPNISDAISVGGGLIVNHEDGVISSAGRGILADDSEGGPARGASTILNAGLIESGEDWAAITLRGDWDDVLRNSGTITGDVFMGDGDDTVTLLAGSTIDGVLNGDRPLGDAADNTNGTPGTFDTLALQDEGVASVDGLSGFDSMEIDAGINTLDVNGDANVTGMSIVVRSAKSGAYNIPTTVDFLTADAISGSFGSVTDELAFLDAQSSVSIDGTTASVILERNSADFNSLADTAKQASVADALQGAGPTSAAYQHFIAIANEDNTPTILDGLSAESHASAMGTQIVQANLVNDTIQGRFDAAFGGEDGGVDPLAYDEPAKKNSEAFDHLLAKDGMRYAGWAKGYGEWLSVDGNSNTPGVDSAVGGVLAGFDVVSGNALFGAAVGYSSSSTEIDGEDAEIDTDTFLLAIYGAYRIDHVRLSGGASYGWSSNDSDRADTLSPGDRLTASYDGNTANLFAEIAYEATFGKAAVEPFAGLSYTNVDNDGFTEEGGPGALASDGDSFDSLASTLGLRLAYDFALEGGARITPRGSVAWRHAFGDLTPEAVMNFAGTNSGFTVEGLPIAEDALVLGAGVEFGLAHGVTIGVDYTGQFADDATSNAVKAVGRVAF